MDSGSPATATARSRTLVAVIIPARNAAATIARTLASLAVDADAIAEVIVVEDGSIDGTSVAAKEAAARHGLRLRIVSGPRRGPGAARNAGMLAAAEDLLFFIDADDELIAGGLKSMRAHLLAHPRAGVVVGGYVRRIDGKADKICRAGPFAPDPRTNVRRYLSDATRTIAMGSGLVRRTAVGNAAFGDGQELDEDTCFWVAVLASAPVEVLERPVMIYNASNLRSDDRFAHAPGSNFAAVGRSFRRLVRDGHVERDDARLRRRLIALKTARVCYHRGDMPTAARFIRLVGWRGLGLRRQWQAIRYQLRIAIAKRLGPQSGRRGS